MKFSFFLSLCFALWFSKVNILISYVYRSFFQRRNQLFKEKQPQTKTDTVFTDFAKCIYEHAAYEGKVPIKWVEVF